MTLSTMQQALSLQSSYATPTGRRDLCDRINPYDEIPMAPRRCGETVATNNGELRHGSCANPSRFGFQNFSPSSSSSSNNNNNKKQKRIPERLLLDLDDSERQHKLIKHDRKQPFSSSRIPTLLHVPLVQMRRKKSLMNNNAKREREFDFAPRISDENKNDNSMDTTRHHFIPIGIDHGVRCERRVSKTVGTEDMSSSKISTTGTDIEIYDLDVDWPRETPIRSPAMDPSISS